MSYTMTPSTSHHLRHCAPQPSRSVSPLPSRGQPTPANPLTDLIYSERTFLDEIKLIDTQIAPLWMKQTRSAAPDFSEQLIHINYICRANKYFYSRLVSVASDPSALPELGDVLMQWVDDLEQPYSEYLRHYIFNINDRHDILDTASIRLRLNTLSLNLSRKITLQVLFDAPLERLKYYKGLYNRLFQSTKPGRPDHTLLLRANNRINALIDLTNPDNGHLSSPLPASEMRNKEQVDAIYDVYDGYVDMPNSNGAGHGVNTKASAGRKAFRDTVMDFYKQSGVDGPIVDEDGQDLANIVPRSVQILSELPSANASSVSIDKAKEDRGNGNDNNKDDEKEKQEERKKDDMSSAPVHMTYIQAPVHKMTLTCEPHNDSDDDDDDDDTPLVPSSSSLARKIGQEQQPLQAQREPFLSQKQQPTQAQLSPLVQQEKQPPTLLRAQQQQAAQTQRPLLAKQEKQQQPVTRQPYGQGTMVSLRSAFATSVDSIPESSHSSFSSFSVPQRSSTSTVHTDHHSSEDLCTQRQQQQQQQQQQNQKQRQTKPASINSERRLSTTPSTQSGLAGLGSPPGSPGEFANGTKQVLFRHNHCFAFHWKDNTWYAADGPCNILVRMTNANRYCISLQLISSGVLYLNAWVMPDIWVQLQAQSDMSLSVNVGPQRENYLVHFERHPDAVELENVMQYAVRETARMMEPQPIHQLRQLPPPTELVDSEPSIEDVPQSLSPVVDVKCKLLVQQDASIWNNLGTVTLIVSSQMPSRKTHVAVQNSKKQTIVSAIVLSRNVKRNGPKQLTILLASLQSSVIYMITFKDDKTANLVFDYIKIQNFERGW